MTEFQNGGLVFCCDTEAEVWRAKTLLTKEPGTVAWLRDTLRAGDVFYDVGANIGCYTLLAAQLVGPSGHVFAFEPHPVNALHLLRNANRNGFGHRVTVCTSALADRDGHEHFRCRSATAGSSGHELGERRTSDEIVELKAVARLETLWKSGHCLTPHAVKIDIDGQEVRVLAGMGELLGVAGLRTLQVETAPETRLGVLAALQDAGYALVERHRTAAGEGHFKRGTPADEITDNCVFGRVAVAA